MAQIHEKARLCTPNRPRDDALKQPLLLVLEVQKVLVSIPLLSHVCRNEAPATILQGRPSLSVNNRVLRNSLTSE
jgi:hypothetical protein